MDELALISLRDGMRFRRPDRQRMLFRLPYEETLHQTSPVIMMIGLESERYKKAPAPVRVATLFAQA